MKNLVLVAGGAVLAIVLDRIRELVINPRRPRKLCTRCQRKLKPGTTHLIGRDADGREHWSCGTVASDFNTEAGI